MKKLLKKNRFSVSLDTCFREVISACKKIPRKNQDGTWITDEMHDAYQELHRLGYAHSLEVWRERSLAGGIYGVSLGRTFFGESMFSNVSNASKLALIQLMEFLNRMKFDLFDCQVNSPHLETLGAKQIGREEFIKRLNKSLKNKTLQGSWKDLQ
jgi:leucyl/phenylalanyl-tRNA--protein transferase